MRRVVGVLLAPRLLPLHLLAVAATVAATLLGLWQLQAWQAQRDAAARDLSALPPAPLAEVLGPDDPFPSAAVGRPVTLTGSWLPDSSFYVTDRELADRSGFWAVTPVAVCTGPSPCQSTAALLVVRGWTADPADAPAPPSGDVRLQGWLQPPEGSGRPDPDPTDDRIPELRIADAIQRVDQDLYGAYLVAQESRPAAALDGLEAITPDNLPRPDSSRGLRNLFYAVEWWVFGAFALFVWWRWTRDEVQRNLRRPTPGNGRSDEGPEVPSNP